MIRFVHTADVHIGMENYGRVNPQTGLSTRLEDFLQTLDESVDYAIDQKVDLYVVAGDIYKTKDPSPTHQREFATRISRLTTAGVKVFMIAGNHDLPLSPSRASAIDIFSAIQMPGVTTARMMGYFEVETRSGRVSILAMPWMIRGTLLSDEERKGASIQFTNQLLAKRAHDTLHQLIPNPLRYPLLTVAHCHMMGARIGAERMLTVGHDPILPPWTFPAASSYVALGHIHKHQAIVRSDPAIVYPGSINRVDFSEADEPKGFIAGELGMNGCDWEFIPVDARPFQEFRITLTNDDPEGSLSQAARNIRGGIDARTAVKIKLHSSRAAALRVRDEDIRRQFSECYWLQIQRSYSDTEILKRPRIAGTENMDTFEALETYLKISAKHSPERREELLRYARSLQKGS